MQARPNVYISKRYITNQSSSFIGKTVLGSSTYASIAKEG